MNSSPRKLKKFGTFTASSVIVAASLLLAACNQTPQVVEKIVKETVQVDREVVKEVEKKVEVEVTKEVVKEVEKKVEVIVTATPVVIAPKPAVVYKEAPALTELVKAGKIPPLDQRIPKEPFIVGPGVIVAAKDLPDWKPGKYGGTLRSAHSSANWSPDFFVMNNEGLLEAPGISTEGIVGNVLRDFEVSAYGKSILFNLREGLKWSDGTPVTTEDIRFTYEDMLKNEELNKSFPARWKTGASPDGKEPTIKILGLFSFEMSYPEAYGGLLRQFTIEAWVGYTEWLNPAHYLKQFHKKYADPAKLAKALADAKLKPDEWVSLFNQKRCQNWDVNQPRCIGYPSLYPWTLVSSDNSQLTFERNPYYYKVDTEGQQLPYIDKLVSVQVQDVEAVNLKVLAGEIDFLRESTALVKVPLYKENEEKGNFNTVLLDMHVDSSALMINQTFTNTTQSADWAKYSQNVKFRQALSMAINRPEIIETIYYGYAALPQRDVGEANSKYDVDAANKLLDEIGLTNKDADGLRLGSDGKPLTILLEHGAHAPDLAPIAEIVGEDLKKVGINVQVKKIDPSLWGTRSNNNDLMSTMFWTHDQGWGGGTGLNEALGVRGAGAMWDRYLSSGGKNGEKPPDWVTKGQDIKTRWWTAVPGSAAWLKIGEEAAAWQRDNLPIIKIVEGVKYPMIANKKLGNVASSGFAIGLNFAGEQLYFNQ